MYFYITSVRRTVTRPMCGEKQIKILFKIYDGYSLICYVFLDSGTD